MTILDTIDSLASSITDLAHHIHRNPELSEQEFQTTELLRNKLAAAGIELPDVSLDTGLVALIRGRSSGRTVALRGDMDALPINEDPAHQICSTRENIMHACGHDMHTASLYGAALALQAHREEIPGNILLLFQPAEEHSKGAKDIIKCGIFERFPIEAVFAYHVWPDYPAGTVAIKAGPLMAAQKFFTVRIIGKGGHGSAPHTTHDPIVPAARIVDALQSIAARRYDPLKAFVLSICYIHAGTACNIIPEEAELGGTCRFLDAEMADIIKQWIIDICTKTANACDCRAEVTFFNEIPPVINDDHLTDIAWKAAEKVYGCENVVNAKIQMGSEDFSMYAQKVPIFMFHAGYAVPEKETAPLHNRHMIVPDHVPVMAAKMLSLCAIDYLNDPCQEDQQ